MIKLKEIVDNTSQYKIYCDMDSVLTDFDAAFLRISDVKTKDGWEYKKKFGKQKFWDIINSDGLEFWSKMPWMRMGKQLWKYLISNYSDVNILSAPSSHDNGISKRGKMIWCKNNLGSNINVILEEDKWKHSGPNCILIDDLEKNIIPWREHGGIGILFKSVPQTILELRKLK